jgi:nicotinamide mononucleotide transporter
MSGDFLSALRSEIFTSPLEGLATGLGVANIVLLIRRSIWNYPVGIVMVSIYSYVFLGARLYSDALLQIFFFVVQIVGWVAWLKHQKPDGEVIVETSSTRELGAALLLTGLVALALGSAMGRWAHAAFPYWDATVAAASVIAQLMLTWRRIENWVWWIGANMISIAIYARKGLLLTSGLYAFFLTMAVLGFVSWRKSLVAQRRGMASVRMED